MNAAHIHLLFNHLPVFACAAAAMLLAYALIKDSEPYRKLSYVLLVIAGLSAPAVSFSGQRAEERVEGIPGVYRSDLHEHEEAGEAATAAMLALGALAIGNLALYAFPNTGRIRGRIALLILVGSLSAFAWSAWTANLGGKIRHTPELGLPARHSSEDPERD
jgi:hypothetical protein